MCIDKEHNEIGREERIMTRCKLALHYPNDDTTLHSFQLVLQFLFSNVIVVVGDISGGA